MANLQNRHEHNHETTVATPFNMEWLPTLKGVEKPPKPPHSAQSKFVVPADVLLTLPKPLLLRPAA
jgi:hypothetical protein